MPTSQDNPIRTGPPGPYRSQSLWVNECLLPDRLLLAPLVDAVGGSKGLLLCLCVLLLPEPGVHLTVASIGLPVFSEVVRRSRFSLGLCLRTYVLLSLDRRLYPRKTQSTGREVLGVD